MTDITNSNIEIFRLLRCPSTTMENLNLQSSFVTVQTSKHIDLPLPIGSYKNANNYAEFTTAISISKEERDAVVSQTAKQADCDTWFQQRSDRITASIFKSCVDKVNDCGEIRNPTKIKSVV